MKLEMRTHGIDLTDKLKAHIESRMHCALARFAARVRRVHVLLEDTNGPKGGTDIRFKVRAELAPGGELVIEGMHDDAFAAVGRAASRISQAIGRRVNRLKAARRGRPLRSVRGRHAPGPSMNRGASFPSTGLAS